LGGSGARGARSRCKRDSREAPLDAGACGGGRSVTTAVSPPSERLAPPVDPRAAEVRPRGRLASEARVAWFFLLPGLLVLTVFFFVPVLAAFVLSLTDFDIYAVADLD